MPITIYGIKNCDTMKKARAWLDKKGVAYDFHDYKTKGVDKAKLEGWGKKADWEILLNRAGTTFKKLPDKDKNGLTEKKAIALMLDPPPSTLPAASESVRPFKFGFGRVWKFQSRSVLRLLAH